MYNVYFRLLNVYFCNADRTSDDPFMYMNNVTFFKGKIQKGGPL